MCFPLWKHIWWRCQKDMSTFEIKWLSVKRQRNDKDEVWRSISGFYEAKPLTHAGMKNKRHVQFLYHGILNTKGPYHGIALWYWAQQWMFLSRLRKPLVGVWFWPVVLKNAKLYKVMKIKVVKGVQSVKVMEILWIVRSEENMYVMGYWCFAWSKTKYAPESLIMSQVQ